MRNMIATRHETTTENPLLAPVLSFDIPTLLMRIKQEETWRSGHRDAITLLKGPVMRVVLSAMHPNRMIPLHQTDSPLGFQVVDGRLQFMADAKSLVLAQGQVLTLQPGVSHSIESLEEAAFLLTIAAGHVHPAERGRVMKLGDFSRENV